MYLEQTATTGIFEFIKSKATWTLTSLMLILSSVLSLVEPLLSLMDGTLLSSLNYAFSASSFGLALLSYFKTVSEANIDNLNSLILTAASSALQIGVQILSHNSEPQPISPEE